jgi:hypothetical protein
MSVIKEATTELPSPIKEINPEDQLELEQMGIVVDKEPTKYYSPIGDYCFLCGMVEITCARSVDIMLFFHNPSLEMTRSGSR